LLPLRSSEERDVFDMSALANLMAPSSPILLPVLSEDEQNNQFVTGEIEGIKRAVDFECFR
jgi:hypothetical protein